MTDADARETDADARERPEHPDEGGESACWLDRVCPECGRLDESPVRPAVCARCGTPFGDGA